MDISRILNELHHAVPLVNPSLLACDFGRLAEEIRSVEAAGAKLLHLDIMDGHFVPNLSIGLPVVRAIRRATELPLDVHLMLSEPGRYIEAFRSAGADILTVHIEVEPEPEALLEKIHALGAGAGISLNPPTPVSALKPAVGHCDLVLMMSVMPGFGGQEFDPVVLEKLREARSLFGEGVLLSVDGGVNRETAGGCVEAGADLMVMGTALFSQKDYGGFIEEMTGLAREAKVGKRGKEEN